MTEELTTYKPLGEYSDEQIRMYKRTLNCQNASNDEWAMLEIMSATYQLNPFLREVWLIPGVGVMVGHAGFLLIAHRSGKFGGMETHSYNADGTIYRGEGNPAYATCNVWIIGSDKPIAKTVYFAEFYRTGKDGKKTNWDKMPGYMLEKVAETHALKRAFSITGLYCPEEFGYDDLSERPPSAGYTGSVDGQPVNVEPLKKTTAPTQKEPEKPQAPKSEPATADDTPKCTKCGGQLMDQYETNKIQDYWDDVGWGTVPAGLCQNCVNDYWRVNIKDKPKEQPNNNPTQEVGKEPATVTVCGQQYKAKCTKCGSAIDPVVFAARAVFVGEYVYCDVCNPENGVPRV
jgi:phage recombination protein Bet